jgi:GNAT superfamily N-acetyltransferase
MSQIENAQITLRPALAGDAVRCQQIAVAAWESIHAERRRLLGDALYDYLTDDWRVEKAVAVASHIEQYTDWAIVACVQPTETGGMHARDGDHVIGFVTFRLDRKRLMGIIGNNAVDPTWQGRGVAGQLYRRVLERFRAEGMRVASVTTGLDAGHAPALAAYRRAGFGAEVATVTLYQEL